ncbi:unnamed protein product, partial [Closterium sp. NIES-54]
AKVADFGVVKLLGGTALGTSEPATRVMGTPVYVDPEYCRSCKATPAADVHRYEAVRSGVSCNFGVVMLVLIMGRKPVLGTGENVINIKQWVRHSTQWVRHCTQWYTTFEATLGEVLVTEDIHINQWARRSTQCVKAHTAHNG